MAPPDVWAPVGRPLPPDDAARQRSVLDQYQGMQQGAPESWTPDDLVRYRDLLAQQPVEGVNIHARPAGMRPSWIAEQTIAPLPLGSMADPVSQLAFLAAPGLLTGLKQAGSAAGEALTYGRPGLAMGQGYRSGEAGAVRLGKPGPWPADEPLPAAAPYPPEALNRWVRAGRGSGVLGYIGKRDPGEFRRVAPELTEGLSADTRAATYKAAVKILQEQKAKSPEGIPSSEDLLTLFERGKGTGDWYDQARQTLWDMFGEDGDLVARLIAATSPQQRVPRNLDLALQAYRQYKQGLDPIPKGLIPDMAPNVYRAIANEPLSGPKVSRFAANILGAQDPVTVDVWMMNLFGLQGSAPSPQQYRMVEEWTTQLARQVGVSPREMQAALWVGGKLLHGPLAGEKASDIPLTLSTMLMKRADRVQPQLETLTGALGHYFTDMAPEARRRLMQTLAVATTLAPAFQGANMGDAQGTGEKAWSRLGVKDPSPAMQAAMEGLIEDAPGFGE